MDVKKTNLVIETDLLVNFCGGCNNSVVLGRYVKVGENQSSEDVLNHKRELFLGFCLCRNVWLCN